MNGKLDYRFYGTIWLPRDFLIIALENIFPPIPSEIVLPFGGFMTTYSNLTVPGVILAATCGSVVGAIILYGVGLLLDVERLEKIVDRWGYILKISKEDIHKADNWFDRYGIWTVLFCRVIPLLRSLISIPAGMSNMNFVLFLIFTTIGSLVWNIFLVSVGAGLGEAWPLITEYIDIYSKIIYAVIAVLVFAAIIIWYFFRFRRSKS